MVFRGLDKILEQVLESKGRQGFPLCRKAQTMSL